MAFVWSISKIEFEDNTLVKGVVLKGSAEQAIKTRKGLIGVLKSYRRKPLKQTSLVIKIGEKEFEVDSDEFGSFRLDLDFCLEGSVSVFLQEKNEELKIIQDYPVVFKEGAYSLGVISDIDDTLLVSHTRNAVKRMATILFVKPKNRKQVGFTQGLLNAVNAKGGNVFYVSRSEQNLFVLLYSFMQRDDIPKGDLGLTHFLSFKKLFFSKKDLLFKQNEIKVILKSAQKKKFILIGDDTQHDMHIYMDIVKKYPERIYKVFIRKTVRGKMRLLNQDIQFFENSKIPFCYFSDDKSWQEEIEILESNLA